MIEYKYLTPSDRDHFLQHGWLHVPGAINPKYLDPWLENLWVRLGYDPNDPSTWKEQYLKMPRHREVPNEEFCTPEAWGKITEVVGGVDRIHPTRERYYGDQFIINFGNEETWNIKPGEKGDVDPKRAKGWHIDNDWYRQFLDSAGAALTLIFLFTDCPERGGGTYLCEGGIEGVVQHLNTHPEGLDHPYDQLVAHVTDLPRESFTSVVGKKGDLFITHQLLPHSHAPNYLQYARVITNPHVNLREDYNLNREDGDYSLCEQVILRALSSSSSPSSPCTFTPTRPRTAHYPRTAYFKRARVDAELARMLADAKSKGLPPESVDSVYLKGEEELKVHERRNGYDLEWGPNGVIGVLEADTNGLKGYETKTIRPTVYVKPVVGASE